MEADAPLQGTQQRGWSAQPDRRVEPLHATAAAGTPKFKVQASSATVQTDKQ